VLTALLALSSAFACQSAYADGTASSAVHADQQSYPQVFGIPQQPADKNVPIPTDGTPVADIDAVKTKQQIGEYEAEIDLQEKVNKLISLKNDEARLKQASVQNNDPYMALQKPSQQAIFVSKIASDQSSLKALMVYKGRVLEAREGDILDKDVVVTHITPTSVIVTVGTTPLTLGLSSATQIARSMQQSLQNNQPQNGNPAIQLTPPTVMSAVNPGGAPSPPTNE
jgi:type IV pilus biogenesis protein PilP